MAKAKRAVTKKTAKKSTAKTAKKNKGGRPVWDGIPEKQVVDKLSTAFKVGTTVIRACLYAGISRSSFYNLVKKRPELKDRFEQLAENPMLVAETKLFESVQSGNMDDVRFLLERRDSRFKQKTEGILDDGRSGGVLTEERKAEIAGALKNWSGEVPEQPKKE